MEDLKVCRICLRQDAKVYKCDQYQLQLYYEALTAFIISKSDILPHYFCYECATLLHKFIKFRQKCYQGQKELKELIKCRKNSVSKLSLISKPTLEILTANERVKTFTITNQGARDNRDKTIETADSPEVITDINKVNEETKVRICTINGPEVVMICPKIEPITRTLNSEDHLTDNTDDDYYPPREDPSNSPSDFTQRVIIKTEDISGEKDLEVDCTEKEIDDEDVIHMHCDAVTNLVKVAVKKSPEKAKNISDKDRSKRKKVDSIRKTLEERKYRFTINKRKSLDMSKWRIISLSDEEALREFENKCTEPKYAHAEYHCQKCYKFFSTVDIMNRHMKLKHAESIGRFECRFCKTRFRLEYQMKRHIRIHYTKYQCLVCHLVVSIEPTALMHEETHSGVMRTCKYCGVEFSHITSYYTHLRTHRTRHVCSTCGASFVSEAGLHQHRRVRHVDDDQSKAMSLEDTYCERCQIKFETPKAYAEHLNSSALHAEVAKSDNEEIPAPKKKYRSRSERKTWKKPTTCNQCGKHFASQAQCMSHHQKEHPRTPFYNPNERTICEICGASLAPGSVATHNNTHTKEKMYRCKICSREFSASTSLKRHQVTHTGEKPFKCPLCDKRFTQDGSMKLHYRTFHLKEPYPKRNRSKKKEETQRSCPLDRDEDSL